jgi:hypothetical protein
MRFFLEENLHGLTVQLVNQLTWRSSPKIRVNRPMTMYKLWARSTYSVSVHFAYDLRTFTCRACCKKLVNAVYLMRNDSELDISGQYQGEARRIVLSWL